MMIGQDTQTYPIEASDSLEITFPSVNRLRLIETPSLNRDSVPEPEVQVRSLPAKSTKFCKSHRERIKKTCVTNQLYGK